MLLTDEEIKDLVDDCTWYDADCERYDSNKLTRAIEQAVIEKIKAQGAVVYVVSRAMSEDTPEHFVSTTPLYKLPENI